MLFKLHQNFYQINVGKRRKKSVVKIYIVRPKPGTVAKNATPRPSSWKSNLRLLDYTNQAYH